MAKRLHSDLDSDEDLEDNTTKDEGWTEGPATFFVFQSMSPPCHISFHWFAIFFQEKEKVFEK